MEEQMFDPSEFEVSEKATTRGPREKEDKPYNVKFNFKKQKIEFDEKIAKEIDLMNNSLAFGASQTKNRVSIIVVPKDEGVFAKGMSGKNKGRAFKNTELAQALVELNLTSGTYLLEKLGVAPAKIKKKTVEGCTWYNLKMVGDPQTVILGEEKEKEDDSFSLEPTESTENLNQ